MPQRHDNRRHSNIQVFTTAFLVCVICSVLVTATTVALRPIQQANRLLDRQLNVLAAADLLEPGKPVEELARQLEVRLVDLASGEFVAAEQPERFDARRAARDPNQSIALSPEQDLAQIKRRPLLAQVYLVRDAYGGIHTIVLPVQGYGLWSQLYGFLALAADTTTVVGLRFYDHGETPGLGGEIANPDWLAKWQDKAVYDDDWNPAIRLVKGVVDEDDPESVHQVDALSGATLTNQGVENLLRFWLGADGFGPFLARLREQGED